ncbi:MAG TPA: alkaline phosphatase family protein [Solirubrobacteraceae bacterium]|nr:alkaline phosphatase family protein [Solirubrobacteraceae bacterium]
MNGGAGTASAWLPKSFWSNYAHDQRTRGSQGSFLNHARTGKLPQVSWLVSSYAHQKDEHPPADVSVGMALQRSSSPRCGKGPCGTVPPTCSPTTNTAPTGSNYQANGAPAPPRDGRDDISDLLYLFSF